MTERRVRRLLTAGTLAAGLALALAAGPIPAHANAAPAGEILAAGEPGRIPGVYIVNFADRASIRSAASATAQAESLIDTYGGELRFAYHAAIQGFSFRATDWEARRLAADPRVASVEAVGVARVTGTQPNPPSWGLDRIDQRNRPLDSSYTFPDSAGAGVTVYVIDTGIRATHRDFGGRASGGPDFITPGGGSRDCNGHGTHVASTAVGTVHGVAKRADVVAIRVLDCAGSGAFDGVIAGVDWVTANGQRPAAANMSLGGIGTQPSLTAAINRSINAGIQYSLAAGNNNGNACNHSPGGSTPNAIAVAASTITDARSSFSNWGSCVDIFAPGSTITGAWFTSDTATNTISGTSMAAPHLAGAAALLLGESAGLSPAQVKSQLIADATTGVISGTNGSPNRLLFVDNEGGQDPDPPGGTVYQDSFETSTGWVRDPAGTDTATTGVWDRGAPQPTSDAGVPMQLGTAVDGGSVLATGRLAGASVGANDLDGGVTTAQSPAIPLPAGADLTLTFSFNFAHLNNSSSADFFRVAVVSGGTATVLASTPGSATTRAGSWQTASLDLSQFAGQSVQLRFQAADLAGASLVEASVDDVRITTS